MGTYELVADLPLHIERYTLEGLVQQVSSDFERKATIVQRGRSISRFARRASRCTPCSAAPRGR